MNNRPTEHRSWLAAIAYAIGVAITAVIFWIVGKIRRSQRPAPEKPISPPENAPPEYEPHDASAWAVTLAGLGFLFALGVVIVAATVLFLALTGASPSIQIPPPGEAISANPPTPQPPPPRLETAPGQALSVVRTQEDTLLYSYAWVDRSRGIVRIPIDRAMVLVAEQGLPIRPGAHQSFEDTGSTIPSGASSGRAPEELQH